MKITNELCIWFYDGIWWNQQIWRRTRGIAKSTNLGRIVNLLFLSPSVKHRHPSLVWYMYIHTDIRTCIINKFISAYCQTKDWLVVSKWGFQKSGYPKSSKVRPFYTIEMYWNPWFWGTPILENLLKCFNFDIEARVLYVSCMGWKHQPDLCLGHNLGPRNLDMWFFSHLWLYTVYIIYIYIDLGSKLKLWPKAPGDLSPKIHCDLAGRNPMKSTNLRSVLKKLLSPCHARNSTWGATYMRHLCWQGHSTLI